MSTRIEDRTFHITVRYYLNAKWITGTYPGTWYWHVHAHQPDIALRCDEYGDFPEEG